MIPQEMLGLPCKRTAAEDYKINTGQDDRELHCSVLVIESEMGWEFLKVQLLIV